MTDEFGQESSGSVRRVTSRDRKRRIESRSLSFPPDDLPIDETQPPDAAVNDDTQAIPESVAQHTATRAKSAPAPAEAPRRPAKPKPQPASKSSAPAAPKVRRRFGWRDGVAILFALLSCGALIYFAYIWQNPYSPLNPLSPPLLPPAVVSETPLPTASATATHTPTARPSATFTPLPIESIGTNAPLAVTLGTPDLTLTLLAGTPSATPPPPPFALLRTGIVYTSHAGAEGCAYSGIAGSVVDFDGQPLNGYTVWITGEEIDSRLTTGSSNLYGAGGFLLQVGDTPEVRPYAAQVLAADGVTPLSEPITFLSRDVCEYNIALIRFVQVGDLPSP